VTKFKPSSPDLLAYIDRYVGLDWGALVSIGGDHRRAGSQQVTPFAGLRGVRDHDVGVADKALVGLRLGVLDCVLEAVSTPS
jgi:hypothetical protein